MSSVAYAHAKFATYWASTTSESTDPLPKPSEKAIYVTCLKNARVLRYEILA